MAPFPTSQTSAQEGPDESAPPPLSLKERHRREREQLILQAAMDLLIEKGYHETSMEEIASRVGISKGAVYLHFPSKEELIAALFDRGVRAFTGMLNETLTRGDTPTDTLSAIIEQIYGNMGKRFQLMSAVSQSPELHQTLAAKREAMRALWEEPTRRVAAVIEEGKSRGEFDRQLPTPLVLSLLWGLLSPRGYQQLIVQDKMPLEDVVRQLRRFFLKGITAAHSGDLGGEEQ